MRYAYGTVAKSEPFIRGVRVIIKYSDDIVAHNVSLKERLIWSS